VLHTSWFTVFSYLVNLLTLVNQFTSLVTVNIAYASYKGRVGYRDLEIVTPSLLYPFIHSYILCDAVTVQTYEPTF